jgi:hypothetical protein
MYWEIVEKCKMKKILLILFVFSLLNFVCAEQIICVDFDKPSAPSNLAVTSSGQNVILTWDAATDIPFCSGIDYYNLTRNGVIIAENITSLTYIDINVPYGTYSYSVYAIDKVAHLGGQAVKNDVVISAPTINSRSSGGHKSNTKENSLNITVLGGEAKSSYVCEENWQCNEWSNCINEEQTRICLDSEECGTKIKMPETTQTCINEKSSRNFLTGAVTRAGKFAFSSKGIVTGLGLITILIGSLIFVKFRKKRLLKNN